MDDFAVFTFFCVGPVMTLAFLGAGLMAAVANSRRRAETKQLREDLDQLRWHQTRLIQEVARLEARPPGVTTTAPPMVQQGSLPQPEGPAAPELEAPPTAEVAAPAEATPA